MSLNVKNAEAHKLAQAIAEYTGESLTSAVTSALRERLARLHRTKSGKTTADELLAIGDRCAVTLKSKPQSHATLLYDHRGLPK